MNKRFMLFGDNTIGEVFSTNGLLLRLRKVEMDEQETKNLEKLLDSGRLGSYLKITGNVFIIRVEDEKKVKDIVPEGNQQ